MARSSIGIVLLIVSLGCSDSHRDVPEPDPDAGPNEPPEEEPQKPVPPPPTGPLSGAEADWAAASDIEIQLEGTQCYGSCPVYKMVLFANGDLRFTGYQFTWKPGTYELRRSAAAAAKLYENLIRRGFLDLRDSYVKREECPLLSTDAPTTIFTLRAGDREKRIEYYKGCEGELAALATMDTMEREIIEVTELAPYLKGSGGCFRSDYLEFEELGGRYVLHDERDQSVGMLRLEPTGAGFEHSWRVTGCDGRERARGERLLRWSCGWMMMPADETALDWPGVDIKPAAVVIGRGKDASELAVQLFTLDAELSHHMHTGSCN